ncbi:MAG: alpha/beta hydrolase [Anaeromyxobacter sp.]
MDPTLQIATARDGTRLAWTSTGAGGPPVMLVDGIGCAGYVWRHLRPALSDHRRVIHWNYRGHGHSEAPRDRDRVTVDDCVDDLFAVLDAAGEQEALLAGHSMGVQIALEAHRRAPSRVKGLVLLCGAPGHPIDTFRDSGLLRAAFPFARAAVERWPDLARNLIRAVVPTEVALELALTFEVDRTRVAREDLARYLDDLSRVDPVLFTRLLHSAGEHDTTDHLPEVDVPTLVVAGERDTFTPMRLSVAMHQAIAGSELLVLPGGTHVGPLEHPARVAERVLAFLARHADAPRPPRRPAPLRAARRGRRAGPR